MSDQESREIAAIKFLLEALEEAIIYSKASGFALKLLAPPEQCKALVDTFSRQVAQQIAPAFALLLESMLSTHEQTIPPDWEEIVRRLIESADNLE